MATAVVSAALTAPMASSRPRATPQLRCFTASIRGQALVQQRSQQRAIQQQQRSVAVRAAFDDEETFEEEDGFQERVVQVKSVAQEAKPAARARWRAAAATALRVHDSPHLAALSCMPCLRTHPAVILRTRAGPPRDQGG